MTENERRTLNKELHKYALYREEIKECAYDLMYNGLTLDYSAVRSGGGSNNGVENRVIASLSENEYKALWVRVFEFTYISYAHRYGDEAKAKLFHLKYAEHLSRRYLIAVLFISTATYNRWLNDLLDTALSWAKHFKLL